MIQTVADTYVMILAAGKGERMQPLTHSVPKPLLELAGVSLLERHLHSLAKMGFRQVVINVAHLAKQIIEKIGDGHTYNLNIQYSDESSSGALETAGGLRNAIDLIESDFFVCINADIFTDYPFNSILNNKLNKLQKAHLVLVDNPSHNKKGDFVLSESGLLEASKNPDSSFNSKQAGKLTFSGISLWDSQFISTLPTGKQALAPVLNQLISAKQVSAEHYQGIWHDIGTPERLDQLNRQLKK